MERREQLGMGNNPMGYTPQQEPPVKLPLAPIFSAATDHSRPKAAFSTRRGSSIFSPTQTLHQPYNPPLHQHHQLSTSPTPPLQSDCAAVDPDPAIADGTSNQKEPVPPLPPPRPPPPKARVAGKAIRYKECLKNHAASMGAHVVDGCGEFMPGGEDATPEALWCAACECHRNFHRKESAREHQPHPLPPCANKNSSSHRAASPPSSALRHHFASPPAMVSFGGGAAAESSSEDLDVFKSCGQAAAAPALSSGSKKRFRTKFSEEQKKRMKVFAVKLGWRMPKQNEPELQQFCGEAGVKRQAFKVWMHNNKQAMKKRERSE